jgi:hypothetical protein
MDKNVVDIRARVVKRKVCDGRYQMILNEKETDYFIEIDDLNAVGENRKWNLYRGTSLFGSRRMLHVAAEFAAEEIFKTYLNEELRMAFTTSVQGYSTEATVKSPQET